VALSLTATANKAPQRTARGAPPLGFALGGTHMKQFTEALLDVYVYILVSGLFQLVVQAVACIVLLWVLFNKGAPAYGRSVLLFTFFNLSLLLWGCCGNILWVFIARDKLYFVGDPVVEWFPYIPFGPWAYDYMWGQQRGHLSSNITLLQMRILWASIASCVWALSWLTFSKLKAIAA
jgi:hypothetical protein